MLSPAEKHNFLHGLASAERCTQVLAAALLDGHADGVAAASMAMQEATAALSGALAVVQRSARLDAELTQRVRRIGHDLALQREACLRRGAVVDRALHSIIPSSRVNTYSGATSGPYARQARRSGAFNLVSA